MLLTCNMFSRVHSKAMICSPPPGNLSSPTVVHANSFDSSEGEEEEFGYDRLLFAECHGCASIDESDQQECDTDDYTDAETHLTMDTIEKESTFTCDFSDSSSYCSKYKQAFTPRHNGRRGRSVLWNHSEESEDDDATERTQLTMSTLTYSKVNSLYGSNALPGYHRGSKGGYYNRHVDLQGCSEDEWETASRFSQSTITQSTLGIGASKPFRPQNFTPHRPYNRSFGGYYNGRDIMRSESGMYDGDDDRNSDYTSINGTDVGSSIHGFLS